MTYHKYIIYIDDDEDDRYLFELACKEYDQHIRLVAEADLEVALNKMKSSTIDTPRVFVVDWNMPRMSGGECIIEIRKDSKYERIPIVVYSTSVDPSQRAAAENLGAQFYSKPSRLEDIVKTIKTIFKRV